MTQLEVMPACLQSDRTKGKDGKGVASRSSHVVCYLHCRFGAWRRAITWKGESTITQVMVRRTEKRHVPAVACSDGA